MKGTSAVVAIGVRRRSVGRDDGARWRLHKRPERVQGESGRARRTHIPSPGYSWQICKAFAETHPGFIADSSVPAILTPRVHIRVLRERQIRCEAEARNYEPQDKEGHERPTRSES